MILEHLVNLEEKELDSLLESLEETLDKLINDTLHEKENEYIMVKLEVTIEILESIKENKDFAEFYYTVDWEYKDYVSDIVGNMNVPYIIQQDNKTMVCLIDLRVD